MSLPCHYLRLLGLISALALGLGATPPPFSRPPLPAHRLGTRSELRLLTTVVNLHVPASALDPSTGRGEVTIPRGLVLEVQSQGGWKLYMRATQSDFVGQPGQGDKPVSDLQLRAADGGRVVVPTTTYAVLAKGGNTHGWSEYAFDVILQATTDDAAGRYTVNLEFVLQ